MQLHMLRAGAIRSNSIVLQGLLLPLRIALLLTNCSCMLIRTLQQVGSLPCLTNASTHSPYGGTLSHFARACL